jgi:hypothetical protein
LVEGKTKKTDPRIRAISRVLEPRLISHILTNSCQHRVGQSQINPRRGFIIIDEAVASLVGNRRLLLLLLLLRWRHRLLRRHHDLGTPRPVEDGEGGRAGRAFVYHVLQSIKHVRNPAAAPGSAAEDRRDGTRRENHQPGQHNPVPNKNGEPVNKRRTG